MKRVVFFCLMLALALSQPECTEECRTENGFEICTRICKVEGQLDTQSFLDNGEVEDINKTKEPAQPEQAELEPLIEATEIQAAQVVADEQSETLETEINQETLKDTADEEIMEAAEITEAEVVTEAIPLIEALPIEMDAIPLTEALPIEMDAAPLVEAQTIEIEAAETAEEAEVLEALPLTQALPIEMDAAPLTEALVDAIPFIEALPIEMEATPLTEALPIEMDAAPLVEAQTIEIEAAETTEEAEVLEALPLTQALPIEMDAAPLTVAVPIQVDALPLTEAVAVGEQEQELQEEEELEEEEDVTPSEASTIVSPESKTDTTLMTFIAIGMIVSGLLLGLWGVMKHIEQRNKQLKQYSYLENSSGYERLTDGDLKVIESH